MRIPFVEIVWGFRVWGSGLGMVILIHSLGFWDLGTHAMHMFQTSVASTFCATIPKCGPYIS